MKKRDFPQGGPAWLLQRYDIFLRKANCVKNAGMLSQAILSITARTFMAVARCKKTIPWISGKFSSTICRRIPL